MSDHKLDILNFIEGLHIRKNGDLVLFRPYDYQLEILDSIVNHRFVVACLPKRCGKSLLSAIVALFFSNTYPDYRVTILSTSREQAQTVVFDYVRKLLIWNEGYDKICKVVGKSKLRVEFENGSVIETVPCVVSAVAGKPINLLLIDELALIEDEETVQVALSQTEREGSKIFVTSTASDEGHLLHRLYLNSEELGVKFIYKGMDVYEQAKHISPKFLEERKKMMPEFLFRRYHMNEFGRVGESVFKPEWVERSCRDYFFKDLEEAKLWLKREFGEDIVGWVIVVGLDRSFPTAERDRTVSITTMKVRFSSGREVYIVLDETVYPTGSYQEITNGFEHLIQRFRPSLFVLESYQSADISEWLRKTKKQDVETVHPTPNNIQEAFFLSVLLFQNELVIIPKGSLLSQELPNVRKKGRTYEGKPHDDSVFAFVWSVWGITLVKKETKEPIVLFIE